MSKILISFLGTGRDKSKREYSHAKYKLAEEEADTSFVALALKKFVKPDKIFLIGTPHSIWEEVYRSFSEYPDENIWSELGDWCEKANKDTPVEALPHKEDIEAAIGNGSKIFPIRYGIDEEQIQQNINIILGLRDYMSDGDEIIVDISSIIRLSDWITGAFVFKLNGSSKQAAILLEQEGGKSAASLLNKFSSVLSLNDMGQLQKQVQELSGIKYPSEMARLALEPTVRDFIRNFRDLSASEFQYRLAEWHFKNGNYLAAYNDLVECVITKVCEETPEYDWLAFKNRESVRNAYKIIDAQMPTDTDQLYQTDRLLSIYRTINPIRNYLIHQSGQAKKKSAPDKISTLREAIANLEPEMKLHAKPPFDLDL